METTEKNIEYVRETIALLEDAGLEDNARVMRDGLARDLDDTRGVAAWVAAKPQRLDRAAKTAMRLREIRGL